MSQAMVATIRERIQQQLAATEVTVLDEGYKHAGHAGAGKGHFHVKVVSSAFTGKLPLQRHRMVYATVADLMNHGIHALSIEALTP